MGAPWKQSLRGSRSHVMQRANRSDDANQPSSPLPTPWHISVSKANKVLPPSFFFTLNPLEFGFLSLLLEESWHKSTFKTQLMARFLCRTLHSVKGESSPCLTLLCIEGCATVCFLLMPSPSNAELLNQASLSFYILGDHRAWECRVINPR